MRYGPDPMDSPDSSQEYRGDHENYTETAAEISEKKNWQRQRQKRIRNCQNQDRIISHSCQHFLIATITFSTLQPHSSSTFD